MTNRKQSVKVLGETSEELPVIYGVPQGSCLGPLLFLIYINDLVNAHTNGEFVLFADDTNIFVIAKTKSLAYKKANEIVYSQSVKLHAGKQTPYKHGQVLLHTLQSRKLTKQ